MGSRRSTAASTSGLPRLTVEEITTTAASPRSRAFWPIATGIPSLRQPSTKIAFGRVRALHLVAELVHDLSYARYADAANADEMDRADIGAQRLHHAGMASIRRCCRDPGRQRETNGNWGKPTPNALDEVGKVARRVGPPYR